MSTRNFALMAALTLLLAAAIVASPAAARRGSGDIRERLNFGVVLQTDRPFYGVGDTARVFHTPYNYTGELAIEWVSFFGGNGCTFSVEVLDAEGRVVWEPRPNCSRAPSAPIRVGRGGGHLASEETIPLVFQNNGGIGTPGEPLPAGFYQIRLTSNYHGPLRQGEFPPTRGLTTEAAVAIRIE